MTNVMMMVLMMVKIIVVVVVVVVLLMMMIKVVVEMVIKMKVTMKTKNTGAEHRQHSPRLTPAAQSQEIRPRPPSLADKVLKEKACFVLLHT